MLSTAMASTTPSTMASTRAVEAAKAVNSLLHFSSGALLEVMEEFFCTPSQTEADDSDLDDSNDELVDPEIGTHKINVITTL